MSWDEPVDTQSFFPDEPIEYTHDVERPAFWPLIAQIVTIVLSLALFLVTPIEKHLVFGLVGYVLTPFVNVALLAIVRAADLKKRSLSWYDRELGKTYLRISSMLTLTGFAVALPIIWRVAVEIAQELV